VDNRNRVAASNLAAREIDMVRGEFYRSSEAPLELANAGTTTNRRPLEGGTVGQPLVVDGTPYTVRTSTQWNVTGAGASACDGGSLVTYPTLGVTVAVSWPNMGTIQPVVTSATMAPEKGDGVVTSTASFVAVRVTDAGGRPNPGRGVTVTGGGSTVSGTTDTQGCAVVQVQPAQSGTAYSARISDSGYVDISGTSNPSRSAGTITRGKLVNNVRFQVDRAGTANIRLVTDGGALLDDETARTTTITLVASEGAGNSTQRSMQASGPITQITGLWPTAYGAYVGTTVPSGGYTTANLSGGGTVDLNAVVAAARARLTAPPAGTTEVRAVASGRTCEDPTGRLVDPAAVSLLPGAWSFYATGATFTCAPGPGQVSLLAGDNGELVWEESTLQVTSAPEGALWAVNRARLGGAAPTSCPGPQAAAIAQNVDGARTGPVALAAGDWFIFATDGAAGGECRGVPSGQYSKVLAYGTATVLAWATPPAAVTANQLTAGETYQAVAWTGGKDMSCTNGAPSGVTTFAKATARATSATSALSPGTWQVFIQDTAAGTCKHAGTYEISTTDRTYTLNLSTTRPGTAR
jgi:hypothetical protein